MGDTQRNTSTASTQSTSARPGVASRVKKYARVVFNHTAKHTGVGIVCAVAYFDPGNWGVDLQAGSQFGYKLLFVVLLSGLFAVFLQVLASRLGCVTGLDLASHCRLLLHNRPKHKLLYRWLLLYPLYVLSEIAIICTDLAELLGSAIAICLLFPKLPLWAGVLLTASDVLVLLALRDPLGGKPVRAFELVIAALVFTVLVCMALIISKVGVHWGDAFFGFIPSGSLFKSGGLYTSIGIIGATVMPHSIFLGSTLATQDRVSSTSAEHLPIGKSSESKASSSEYSDSIKSSSSKFWNFCKNVGASFLSHFRVSTLKSFADEPKSHRERENMPYSFVVAHVYHGMADIVISLLGFAVVINALILILASAVFFYGSGKGSGGPASLFDAYDLLKSNVGQAAATLFALALLASGQSSSIVATIAGQAVSEGFLRWRLSPILRRLLTRLLGIIPSMMVAIGVGRQGVDTLLVASQVALSIILPFIIFPLIYLTSSKTVMSVRKPREEPVEDCSMLRIDVEASSQDEVVDYSNGKVTASLGYLIWFVVVAANVYAIVTLAMGQTGSS